MCRREICTGRQSCYFEQYTTKHGSFSDFKCIFKSHSQKVVQACAVAEQFKKRNWIKYVTNLLFHVLNKIWNVEVLIIINHSWVGYRDCFVTSLFFYFMIYVLLYEYDVNILIGAACICFNFLLLYLTFGNEYNYVFHLRTNINHLLRYCKHKMLFF